MEVCEVLPEIFKIMKQFFSQSLCDICGIKKSDFKNPRLFKMHYDQDFDLKLPCKKCSKEFPTAAKPKIHEKIHKDTQGTKKVWHID